MNSGHGAEAAKSERRQSLALIPFNMNHPNASSLMADALLTAVGELKPTGARTVALITNRLSIIRMMSLSE